MAETTPVSFSGQLKKIEAELKQCDMEIMENTNVVIAAFSQASLVPHALGCIDHAKGRKNALLALQSRLKEEINRNENRNLKDDVHVDPHYL